MARRINGGAFISAFLMLAPLLCFIVSLSLGRSPLHPLVAIKILTAPVLGVEPDWTPMTELILLKVRLPRVLAGMIVGSGLAASGAAFQGLFRNPLVSPYILGVASGAGLGAALAIVLGGDSSLIQLCSFACGGLAVFLSYSMASTCRGAATLVHVLSGVVVGAFFTSMLSLMKYLADPYEKLPSITYWLMGSLASVNQDKLLAILVPMLLGLVALMSVRWRINLLAFGDEEAKALGVDTGLLRLFSVAAATLLTASAVSICGIVGWVGLVIPHFGRMLVGPDYSRLMPACISLGACYLVLIDVLARTATDSEIPLGILTASIGAPVFALLLRKGKLGWI